jgi:hypothetical protein
VNLREWQLEAHRAIRSGQGDAASLFVSGAGNLFVYRTGYRLRVLGTLRDDFELLERLLGKAEFARKVDAFCASPLGYHIELGSLSPAFAAYLEKSGETATVLRAVKLGLLELAARSAIEPEAGGRLFGLHPSAGLLENAGRFHAVWREDGFVRRERIRGVDFRFLRCFKERAELVELSVKLEAEGLSQNFVRDSAALWTKLGLLVAFRE